MENEKLRLATLCTLFAFFVVSGCSSNAQGNASVGAPINESSTTQEFQQYMETAAANDDAGMCLRIPNKMPTCIFTSACLARVAVYNRDSKICDKIEPCKDAGEFDVSEFAAASCKSDVELAKVKDVAAKGDYKNCLKLAGTFERYGGELVRSDLCLMQIATNKSDTELCNMIGNANLKETCLFYSSLNLTED